MKLILARHGETVGNVARVLQGQSHGKLNETGIKQVKLLAERLKPQKFDVIISSDLARAVDTAKEVAKYHTETPLKFSELLRERDFGEYEGESFDGIDWADLPQEVESDDAFIMRARKAIEELKDLYMTKTVLVVSHGGFIMAMVAAVTGKTMREAFELAHPKNTSLSTIEIDETGEKIVELNDFKHLSQL